MSKVLVIDQSLGVCASVERMLGQHGFDVGWEQDANVALSTVDRHAPDVVLCAVSLPEIDGFEVCRSLKSNPLLRHIPVVLVADRVTSVTHENARAVDAAAVVAKPFTGEDLVETVRTTLGMLDPPSVDAGGDLDRPLDCKAIGHELQGLSALGSRYACIVDRDQNVVATASEADAATFSLAADHELPRLAAVALAAADVDRTSTQFRLTVETDDGVRMVEQLGANHQLVVAFPDVQSLGKARLVIRQLRGRVERLLDT